MLHRLSEAFQESITDTKTAPTISSQSAFSKKIQEGWENAPNTYAYPNAPLDPNTQSGLVTGKGKGGVEAVKAHYDHIHRMANDNSKLNVHRANEVKQAYGIDLPNPSSSKIPGPTQVFAVGNAYVYKREDAPAVCAKYGAKVATTAQLEAAQKMGANWCYSGWVAEGSGKWPITTQPIGGCGGRTGIIEWTPYFPEYGWDGHKAGINCYGPKPRPEEKTEEVIQPFNDTLWDQPTEKGYITIDNGYLETTTHNHCFSGLSPEQAQKNCDRLGSQCKGFSYAKDGSGFGCYKGNHDAGLNGNAAYKGYVKIPSVASGPVDGRYIRLDYNHVEGSNLAQILVYSSENGPNIITPSTKVTQSSQHAHFDASHFVNHRGNRWYNFAHSSGHEVPWIEVDLGSTVRIHKIVLWNRQDCCQSRILGTVLSVLNDEREAVYLSNPIESTNQSYTWYPPNANPFLDRDPIRSQRSDKPTKWKCLTGMPTPLRRNDGGDVECMSYDSVNCLWGDDNSCRSLLTNANFGAVRPLVCGVDHARKWGGSGYDAPGHWCERADDIL